MSDDRTIVGVYETAQADYRCYRTAWQEKAVDIGVPDDRTAYCEPDAVNGLGWIAGSAGWDEGSTQIIHAWIWRDGVFQDLGALGSQRNYAWASSMNDAGQVVGYSETDALQVRAFLWDGTRMLDIGESDRFQYSAANSISNRGDIVGTGLDDDGRQHALRFAQGEVIDLQDETTNLGAMALESAFSVNDDGVIIGYGELDGDLHGFVLLPQ